MFRSLITAFALTVAASPAAAITPQEVDKTCRDKFVGNTDYKVGFGKVVLSGKPLIINDNWTVPHDTVTITFPHRKVVLTISNTSAFALGDYISTTLSHRNDGGTETFGVLTAHEHGLLIGLIQPYIYRLSDGEIISGCFWHTISLED